MLAGSSCPERRVMKSVCCLAMLAAAESAPRPPTVCRRDGVTAARAHAQGVHPDGKMINSGTPSNVPPTFGKSPSAFACIFAAFH